jgi:ribonuclease HI
MHNGKMNARCRSGIWVGRNNDLNKAVRVPGDKQSNQIGELAAVIMAAEALPNYGKITIITDSRYVMFRLRSGRLAH